MPQMKLAIQFSWPCSISVHACQGHVKPSNVDPQSSPPRARHDAVICLQISTSASKMTRKRRATSHLLRLAEKQPILRSRDVAHQGIHTSTLTRMTRTGTLRKGRARTLSFGPVGTDDPAP